MFVDNLRNSFDGDDDDCSDDVLEDAAVGTDSGVGAGAGAGAGDGGDEDGCDADSDSDSDMCLETEKSRRKKLGCVSGSNYSALVVRHELQHGCHNVGPSYYQSGKQWNMHDAADLSEHSIDLFLGSFGCLSYNYKRLLAEVNYLLGLSLSGS